MSVRKALIPAAGLGTRFLPATKALPKEIIPVIDKPALQYVVEEAVNAGIEDIVLVSSRGKGVLEDHFDRSVELEHRLEEAGKLRERDEIRRIGDLVQVFAVRQKEPLGFGDAVLLGEPHVGEEPFVLLLPDEIVPEPRGGETRLLERMIAIHEEHRCSVVMAQEVPKEQVSAYGVVDTSGLSGDRGPMIDMIEKPPIDEAPSNLASRGRYLFTPGIFSALRRTEPGVGGEVQLTDAVRLLLQEEEVYVYVHEGPILDVGKKIDYLRATVELALRREDLGEALEDWLRERLRGD